MNLLFGGFDFTHADGVAAGMNVFMKDRNIIWSIIAYHWAEFAEWIAQPHIYAIILAWTITFIICAFFMLSLGFGPVGVVGGSLAAAFQGWAYGAFTPAGGIFATLTSLAMIGWLVPFVAAASAIIATIVAIIVSVAGFKR